MRISFTFTTTKVFYYGSVKAIPCAGRDGLHIADKHQLYSIFTWATFDADFEVLCLTDNPSQGVRR
jgi:hypothetical protein